VYDSIHSYTVLWSSLIKGVELTLNQPIPLEGFMFEILILILVKKVIFSFKRSRSGFLV
jgi:hypothetical protein